jgi:hypothetical protein
MREHGPMKVCQFRRVSRLATTTTLSFTVLTPLLIYLGNQFLTSPQIRLKDSHVPSYIEMLPQPADAGSSGRRSASGRGPSFTLETFSVSVLHYVVPEHLD